MRNEKLALVIPALREAESLRALLPQVLAVLGPLQIPFEIIVVDDDSEDGTEQVVSKFAAEDPRIRLLIRRGERGLAGAILHGWQHTDAAILGAMDADGQHPPELLPELVSQIYNGHEIVIASRYAKSGRWCGWKPLRMLISAAAIGLTRPLLQSPIRIADPMSGFFLVRRGCVAGAVFRTSGFKLLLDILARGVARGAVRSVAEVPFQFGRRARGRSKANLAVAWHFAALLAVLYGVKLERRFQVAGARAEEAESG